MSDLFDPKTRELFAKRRAEIEACIVASFFPPNEPIVRSEYEIRRFVMDRRDWVRPVMVTKAVASMVRSGRIRSEMIEGRAYPSFSLPVDPEQPFLVRRERLLAFDRHVLSRMELPKFFRIATKEPLRSTSF